MSIKGVVLVIGHFTHQAETTGHAEGYLTSKSIWSIDQNAIRGIAYASTCNLEALATGGLMCVSNFGWQSLTVSLVTVKHILVYVTFPGMIRAIQVGEFAQ